MSLKWSDKYHVCNVLKDFTKDLYHYESSDWLNEVFDQLDIVRMCNQYITNAFTEIKKREMGGAEYYKAYRQWLFPQFLYEYDEEIIKEHTDRINDEIDAIQPAELYKIKTPKLNRWDLLDLTVPYSKIIAILRKYDDRLIERAEYGYYVGSLLKMTADEWRKKYGDTIFIEPDWEILSRRVENFREGVFCTLKERGV